jgi:hypothetical protein
MLCMFCEKLLMSSSSTIYCLDLLFLVKGESCIKHTYDNFCIVILRCKEHRKSSKSIV